MSHFDPYPSKTAQNSAVTPPQIGPEWPFCFSNLQKQLKFKHNIFTHPLIQVAFLVAFFVSSFFNHAIQMILTINIKKICVHLDFSVFISVPPSPHLPIRYPDAIILADFTHKEQSA